MTRQYIASTYGFNSRQRVEYFDSQEDALEYLRATAVGYLDGGDNPPSLEDWFVATITHSIRLTQVPFEYPVLEVVNE